MAEPKPPRLLAIVLVLVVLIAGGVGLGLLYYENHKSSPATRLIVQSGDNVTVNYVGVFGSSPQQGRVFDTSIYSIALNNVSWPKSLGYHSRGGKPSDYTPLPVHVGPNAPSSGYTVGNLTFSSVVTGFWQGLVGLPGNQTAYVTVPPSLGYGNQNASCYVSQPLTYTVPVTVSLSRSAFTTAFPGVTPLAGTEYVDPTYNWTDTVLSVNSSAVAYENLPAIGYTTSNPGWPVTVTNLSSTTITLTNQLTPSSAGLVAGKVTGSGLCDSTTFVVSQVNPATGTYLENFNSQVSGQTLIFIVTVVDIFPPAAT
jgi:FKBP-type peptidyl-prolyl cis-trans isomerase 2